VQSRKMALVRLQRKRTQFQPWKVGIILYEDINRDAMPGFLDEHAIRGCHEALGDLFRRRITFGDGFLIASLPLVG